MKGKARARFTILAVTMAIMMVSLIWQLSNLTLANGAYYAEMADDRRSTTVYSTGARGRILDRTGIPLAYDETSFNVQFSRNPEQLSEADSALSTEALITALSIIEAGGGEVIDTFYIYPDEENYGEYVYNWGSDYEATQKARYKNFLNAMGISIPSKYENDTSMWMSANDAYKRLRLQWKIPVDMPYEKARSIMSIRQELNMNKWQAYEPVTIAYNVPMEVVAQLEMRANEMPGISTLQSTTRVYPWGKTAAHVLGYLRRQVGEVTPASLVRMGYTMEELESIDNIYATENGVIKKDNNGNDLMQMTAIGYSYNDYIGVAGIERTMERYLTANTNSQRGKQTLEVNKYRAITRELEKTYAKNGNDVMLTIDLQLQTVVESALENAITKIREYEEYLLEQDLLLPENKRKYKNPDTIKLAETGSIVVLDVNTGYLLAMASYPTFDPNIFMNPISEELNKEIFGDDSNMPTLNRAISSRTAPGSIFKMATGLAGLMEGAITTDTRITDKSPYTVFESGDTIDVKDAPSCWVSSSKRHEHANLDVSDALAQSCNYFFFTVADRIGINKLDEWSNRLGMGSPTNVELPAEISGHIGGQRVLYDNAMPRLQQKSSLPSYVYKQLLAYLELITKDRPEVDPTALESCAEKILALQDGQDGATLPVLEGDTDSSVNRLGGHIRSLLASELGLPVMLTRSQTWVQDISSMLTELRWKPALTIRAGMGQGITVVTPLEMARYAATFVNGGNVFDVHVVDRIIDENGKSVKVFEPTLHDKIDAPQEYWDLIRKGLERVVSPEDEGTASEEFTDEFISEGYSSKIIGKTGSAQISAQKNNIDIENTSWFVTMMPKDDPEIVIITCLPHGLSGSKGSIPAVEEITRFYLDRKDASAKANLIPSNGIIP